ncbi:MAG: peptide chain release factor N(5)-glutamine methyltransferase [Proteobacteria bacterium]|nr:peptide chain release factor N(5)-glutamine methyltransferase [Pseudomonadota bacterium]MBU1686502.1 peptide chain release factor N(5)-glutamine methyltransferase [Pseudomonadota bacterium]
MRINNCFQKIIRQLNDANVPNPRLEAELLLGFTLGLDRLKLFLAEREMNDDEVLRLNQVLTRRLNREPLAYITSEKEFWSLPFYVSSGVLIPRPETEVLIEGILGRIPDCQLFSGLIADLGTGSGAIAVILARELPKAHIIAVDTSKVALKVAARNLERHGVSNRVSLVLGNWLSSFIPSRLFQIIVSNPPYVSTRTRGDLEPELAFEPETALFAGDDGLDEYRKLIPSLMNYLSPGGLAVFEIGSDQDRTISELIYLQPGLGNLFVLNDYSNLPRVIGCRAN